MRRPRPADGLIRGAGTGSRRAWARPSRLGAFEVYDGKGACARLVWARVCPSPGGCCSATSLWEAAGPVARGLGRLHACPGSLRACWDARKRAGTPGGPVGRPALAHACWAHPEWAPSWGAPLGRVSPLRVRALCRPGRRARVGAEGGRAALLGVAPRGACLLLRRGSGPLPQAAGVVEALQLSTGQAAGCSVEEKEWWWRSRLAGRQGFASARARFSVSALRPYTTGLVEHHPTVCLGQQRCALNPAARFR